MNVTTICSILFLFFNKVKIHVAIETPLILMEKEPDISFGFEYRYPTIATRNEENGRIKFTHEYDPAFKSERFCPAGRGTILSNPKSKFCLYKIPSTQYKCDGDVEPEVVPYLDNGEPVKCGGTKNAKMYRFAYHLCFRDDDFEEQQGMPEVFIDIYRFCFDEDAKKTTYVEYELISPKLLENELLGNQRNFESDIKYYSFNIVEFSQFRRQMSYHEKQKDIMKKTMLVPVLHMAMSHWKKPLYHEANIRLLRPPLVSLWDQINEYVRNLAIEKLGEIKIRAGVFDSTPFAMDAQIWWKLIYDATAKYAIAIIINNVGKTIPLEERLCTNKSICDDNGWIDMIPKDMQESAYCCSPDVILSKIGLPTDVEVFNLFTYIPKYQKAFVAIINGGGLIHQFPMHAEKNPTDGSIDYGAPNQTHKINYFCPAHTPEHQAFISKHSQYESCLFKTSSLKDSCEKQIIPATMPLVNSIGNQKPCGKGGRGSIYTCGYLICLPEHEFIQNMDIYELCIDNEFHRTLFVNYKIISPNLIGNEALKDEKDQNNKTKQKKLNALRRNSSKLQIMVGENLIPPSQMAFDLWKKPLALHHNVDLLRYDLVDLVNSVNDNLTNVAKKLGEIRIKSGVLDSPRNNQPDATIWWKLIYDEKEEYAIAIIIHNVTYIEEEKEKLCVRDICPHLGWKVIPSGSEDIAYCCNPKVITEKMDLPDVQLFDFDHHPEFSYFKEVEKGNEVEV